MIYISHRGNTIGPNLERENSPQYIVETIKEGYNIEIDVWKNDDVWSLGHDLPTYEIDINFLYEYKHLLWCHAKNLNALEYLLLNGFITFWHNMDKYTLTSNGYIWTLVGEKLTSQSIVCLPELNKSYFKEIKVSGICSDFIINYKN